MVRPAARIQFIVVIAALAVLGTARAAAVDLRSVLTGYSIATWTQRDGAPDGTIWALAQDAQGYLWLGGDTGLYRFDGMRVVPWEVIGSVAIPRRPVQALIVARDDSLWVGFSGEGGVVRIQKGLTRIFVPSDGLPLSPVTALVEDARGRVWAGTNEGLFQFDADRWRAWGGTGLPSGPIWTAYADGATLLVATTSGVYARSGDAPHFTEVSRFNDPGVEAAIGPAFTGGLLPSNVVRAITTDTAGRVFVTDTRTGFRVVGASHAWQPADESGRGFKLLRDSRGNVWVATGGQGLWRVSRAPTNGNVLIEKATSLTGLAAEGAFSLLEDREGNIWAGTDGALNRLTPQRMTALTDLGVVAAVQATPDGRMWAGTSDGLFEFQDPDRDLSVRHRIEGVTSVRSLSSDSTGAMWVAADRAVLRVAPGALRAEALPQSEALQQVDALTVQPDGTVLVYDVGRGLLRWTRYEGFEPVPLPESVSGRRIIAMHADGRGEVWLSVAGGPVVRLTADGARVFGVGDGLANQPHRVIHEDRTGAIWLGSTNALSRFSGSTFETVGRDTGLPLDLVRGVSVDRNGFIWVAAGEGLIRLHQNEFAKAAATPRYQVAFTLFDRSDGVAGVPRILSERTSAQTAAGRLWFVTGAGVTVVDPTGSDPPPTPARAEISAVTADGLALIPAERTTLSPGTARLLIEYSALNLTAPHKIRFRFRLNDVDPAWVDAGSRRQADYTSLPPGRYRFEVQATDARGGWSGVPAAYEFEVSPWFYQTPWFVALVAAGLGVAGWTTWHVRLRQVRKRFSLLLQERARISREIHDTLLQGLVGVALQCDTLARQLHDESPEASTRIKRVRQQAEAYVKEARETIFALRSLATDRDFSTQLQTALTRVASDYDVPVDVRMRGRSRPIESNTARQLILIAQEAVTNAVRHGRPTRVQVEVEQTRWSLRMTIADDGSGFDATRVPTGPHYGIVSMRERAAAVGGAFRLTTHTGAGTRVEVRVRRWWPWQFQGGLRGQGDSSPVR